MDHKKVIVFLRCNRTNLGGDCFAENARNDGRCLGSQVTDKVQTPAVLSAETAGVKSRLLPGFLQIVNGQTWWGLPHSLRSFAMTVIFGVRNDGLKRGPPS
jgi:hypothetical protein